MLPWSYRNFHLVRVTESLAEAVSLNRAIEYFMDSLMGRSLQTRNAYYRDLLQFKLYLVFYEPHTLCRAPIAFLS